MKNIASLIIISIIFTSCVSQKKYQELETLQTNTKNNLNSTSVQLNTCKDEKETAITNLLALKDQVKFLKTNNQGLINNLGNLTTLSQKGAENLEKSLESMKEKDIRIQKMQDAVTRKDSVSISDKLLFNSGSYMITKRAKEVLGKVAAVVNNRPELEFLVEGHTDNVPIKTETILDNWDLSVMRATAVVRILQNDFQVSPERMTAAGRSSYIPLFDNDNASNRAKNRRTRIIVLPKLDQFYDLIEKGMESAQ